MHQKHKHKHAPSEWLNTSELARLWRMSEATLRRWRKLGMGPAYLKLHRGAVYNSEDIEHYEKTAPVPRWT